MEISMEIGTEVAIIHSADLKEVRFMGYGTYHGGHPPKLCLIENGEIILGSQCWWIEKEKFARFVGDRKIVHVYPEGDVIPFAKYLEKKDV